MTRIFRSYWLEVCYFLFDSHALLFAQLQHTEAVYIDNEVTVSCSVYAFKFTLLLSLKYLHMKRRGW